MAPNPNRRPFSLATILTCPQPTSKGFSTPMDSINPGKHASKHLTVYVERRPPLLGDKAPICLSSERARFLPLTLRGSYLGRNEISSRSNDQSETMLARFDRPTVKHDRVSRVDTYEFHEFGVQRRCCTLGNRSVLERFAYST